VPLIVSVPSGEFPGICRREIFAKRIGLAVRALHRRPPTQKNDARCRKYLRSGEYSSSPGRRYVLQRDGCGNPNNFPRLLDLCRNRLENVAPGNLGTQRTDEEL